MNAFQILGLTFIAIILLRVLHSIRTRQLSMGTGIAWMLLWLCAAATTAQPKLTIWIARALGIGRGADLVFYGGILGMLIGFYAVFARLRRIEVSLTRIVRHLAIEEKSNRYGNKANK